MQGLSMESNQIHKKKLLILEGNMGAGKSTMLKILNKMSDVNVIPEPTDKWQNVGSSGNILDLFYSDTKRWAYTFQAYAFLTRVQTILAQQFLHDDKDTHILERSIYCDRFCFAKTCYELGTMSEIEWNMYQEWFLWVSESFVPRPHGFIYVRTSPEVAYQRVATRHRHEETGVSLAYVQRLHEKHEDWLVRGAESLASLRDVPVLILECDKDFEHDQQEADRHIQAIREFIDKLNNKIQPATVSGHEDLGAERSI
jgi:deoxyadenosine/deoxycytidine kinase